MWGKKGFYAVALKGLEFPGLHSIGKLRLRLTSKDLFSIFISIVLFIPALEVIGYPDKALKILGVSSSLTLFISIVSLALIRFFKRKSILPVKLVNALRIGSLIFLVSSVALTFIDNITYVNFVYSHTRINYDKLAVLGLGLCSLWLIGQNNKFFKKNYKNLIGGVPLLIGGFFTLMYFWPFDALRKLLREDGPVEWLQFYLILASAVLAFAFFYKHLSFKKHIPAAAYLILFVGLLFVAGEEISWGQRVFGIATPSDLAVLNRQQEIGVHNIYSVENIFLALMIVANLFCAFSFLITRFYAKAKKFKKYVPSYYYFFYFAPLPFYYLLSLINIIPFATEAVEMFFYLGVATFFLKNYLSLPRLNPEKRKKYQLKTMFTFDIFPSGVFSKQ